MVVLKTNPWWFVLNIIRVLSVITLALIFASSIVMMVRDANAICRDMSAPDRAEGEKLGNKLGLERAYIPLSTVPRQPGGPFFAILSRLLVVSQCPILILAELGRPKRFFIKSLPILGPQYGVGILGIMQVLLSTVILSHRVPKFALVPAFLLFGIGCLNTALGLALRQNLHAYRTWKTEACQHETSEETHPTKCRTSFRPGSERTMAYKLTDSPVYSDHLEKQPRYETAYMSKGSGHGCSKLAPPGGLLQCTGSLELQRQAQSRTEKGGYSISAPEQAHPKH
ncbi:unnamed protein product [Rhizoctonia solani]|uniref:DUF7598 domain-containing protein n=1 Tax=Rhizoctonia solani TaxID=456999 RepID=A0A8H3CNE1_9AGAM|nr:unnamed protein product [Rhizoctonia solani]